MFEWQFFNSFYPTVCVAAEDGGQIIGMFGLQRRTLNNGTPIGHLIDLLVDKNWQGQGIFKTMGQIALNHWKDIEVFTVLANLSGKIACEKALGIQTIAKIDDWVLKNPLRFRSAGVSKLQSQPSHVRYRTSQPYFRWRFGANPIYTYSKIAVSGCGFLYTKKFTDPVTKESFMDIVDYRLNQSSTESLVTLWGKSVEQLIGQGEKNISAWALPHTPLAKALKLMGFEALPRERYFCVKTRGLRLKRLLDITSWDLVQADAEIY